MEKEELLICFDEKAKEDAQRVMMALRGIGYQVKEGNGQIKEGDFVLLLLNKETTLEGLYLSNPWLKQQFEDSSFRGFRMMPIIPLHGKSEDIDTLWENGIGELYDELVSGEFKPFGLDLDDPASIKEFHRVYEEYSE